LAGASPLLRLSSLAVAAAAVAAAAGLAAALLAPSRQWHPWLLGGAGLLVLPSALHPLLLAGLAVRGWSRGWAGVAGGLAGLLALAAVVAGLLGLDWRAPAAASMLLQALLAAHAGQRWWGRRGEPWWPWAAPPLLGLAGLPLSGGGCTGLEAAAHLYAAPMIAVVTLYTTGRNYGVTPSRLRAAAVLAPAAASAALLAAGAPHWQAPAALTPTLLAALLRPWRLLPSAGRPQLRGVAWLHATWPLAGAVWLYKALAGGPLEALHAAALAFALPTVLLHAPLLAPQLLPAKARPPATPLAYLASQAAALLWPAAAAPLLAASLAVWLLEAGPKPRLNLAGPGKGRPRGGARRRVEG